MRQRALVLCLLTSALGCEMPTGLQLRVTNPEIDTQTELLSMMAKQSEATQAMQTELLRLLVDLSASRAPAEGCPRPTLRK